MSLRKYAAPNMDFVYFDAEDIIATSETGGGDIGGGTVIPGDDDWED